MLAVWSTATWRLEAYTGGMSSPEDRLWLLNTLVHIRVSYTLGRDGLSAIEHQVGYGDSPPLHSHRTEDELFHVLAGDFRIVADGVQQLVGPGAVFLVPKGVVHTYLAESPQGGRFMTVTRGGDFERFVRALGRPAARQELPPPSPPPTAESISVLTQLAAAHGIVIHGPPLQPQGA